MILALASANLKPEAAFQKTPAYVRETSRTISTEKSTVIRSRVRVFANFMQVFGLRRFGAGHDET